MEHKKIVPGVILVLSCHKHVATRVPLMKLDKQFAGWPIVTVIGDPSISNDFERYEGENSDTFVLKCEDSYSHICKKSALAMRLILQTYDITHGVLRCNDDLILNFDALGKFLNEVEGGDVPDYVGYDASAYKDFSKRTFFSSWVIDYHRQRLEDFTNPLLGLQGREVEFGKYCEFPTVHFASGVLMYLSKNACTEIVRCNASIGFDVFTHVEGYGYPYICEDVGIGYMMMKAGYVLQDRRMYSDVSLVMEPWCLAHHTSLNK